MTPFLAALLLAIPDDSVVVPCPPVTAPKRTASRHKTSVRSHVRPAAKKQPLSVSKVCYAPVVKATVVINEPLPQPAIIAPVEPATQLATPVTQQVFAEAVASEGASRWNFLGLALPIIPFLFHDHSTTTITTTVPTPPILPPVTSTPEPSTLLLSATGIVALLGIRRKSA